MKYFLDSAKLDEIKQAYHTFGIDGVTTNPRHIMLSGKPFLTAITDIANWIKEEGLEGYDKFPVSVEINPHLDDTEEMIAEARKVAAISPNFVIKIPCTEAGVPAARMLEKEGIRTNVTLVFSPAQAILPAAPSLEFVQAGKNTGQGYMDLRESIRIPYFDNSITVGFTIDGAFAGNLSAECLLEGVDSAWTSTGRVNRVTYTRLPSGHYTLRLRATDGLGNYSPDTILPFTIRPPWYQTVWAGLGALALVALLLFVAYRLMRHRLQVRHLRRLKAEEAERLRLQNEQLQNELEQKNAELFTQASFIIRKNELMLKLKELVDELVGKNTQKALLPLFRHINGLLSDNLDAEADWQTFLIQFEQKHHSFFKKLKETYPLLTSGDLRLCACLKLNMDTKDIASLMNLSIRAVENNRYRLRKKLGLQSSQNLNDFFLAID